MAEPRLFDYYEPGKDSIDDLIDYSKNSNYKDHNTTVIKNANEEIKKITTDLKLIIDQLSNNSKLAKDCINQIAKILDESGICPHDQIGRYVKEILADKIKEKKITTRWIDRNLPPEYKRVYRKREVSSLSQENAITEKTRAMELVFLPGPQNEDGAGQDILQKRNNIEENRESKKYTEDTVPKSDSKQLNELIEFIICKNQKDLVDKGLDNFKKLRWFTINKSGVLIEVTSDLSVEVQ